MNGEAAQVGGLIRYFDAGAIGGQPCRDTRTVLAVDGRNHYM
jgi:hypothetical protein